MEINTRKYKLEAMQFLSPKKYCYDIVKAGIARIYYV